WGRPRPLAECGTPLPRGWSDRAGWSLLAARASEHLVDRHLDAVRADPRAVLALLARGEGHGGPVREVHRDLRHGARPALGARARRRSGRVWRSRDRPEPSRLLAPRPPPGPPQCPHRSAAFPPQHPQVPASTDLTRDGHGRLDGRPARL